MTVLAVNNWKSNAELIADVAKLYLNEDDIILDTTYGEGTFWNVWMPNVIVANRNNYDFCEMPHDDDWFDVVVLDPPYKLNGTPDPDVDARYGVDKKATWQERMALIHRGIPECARVLKTGGIFLLKCMDQVSSGAIRWQTYEFAATAAKCGLDLIDRFDMIGHSRLQPMEGRTQRTAHGRGSTLLVFRKGDS